jgi:hypothetical protein
MCVAISSLFQASYDIIISVHSFSCTQVDRQEAELIAEQRRLQIERANKILFDESDRAKGFHSTLQKSDTIQENELLLDYKKQIRVLQKAQEAAFVEQQRQALEVSASPAPIHEDIPSVTYSSAVQ